MGPEGQNNWVFFSESIHVVYQTNWELCIEHHTSTYSVLTYTLGPLGCGQKVKLFSEVVMLHIYKIKGNGGIEQLASTHSVLTLTLGPWVGSKCQNIFSEVVMLHIKFKGMEHRAPCKHISCPNTHPRPLGCGQNSKTFFLPKVVMLHIKLKEMKHRAPCKHTLCPYTHTQSPRWGQKVKRFFF